MSINRRQTQLRNTSRMNIFVLLMSLLLINGHCSAAYASSSLIPLQTDQDASVSYLVDLAAELSHHSDNTADCFAEHDGDPTSLLFSSSWSQLKDKQDDAKPLLASMNSLPEPRAGPCNTASSIPFVDFVTPPLFYTLCVLRL